MHPAPELLRLDAADAVIAFDLPDVLCAGGTRLAPDVDDAEVALLARAMTYKFAALGDRLGGAKAGVRADPGDPSARDAAMARYCDAVLPLVRGGRFLTGPDMGTFEEDFAPLRASDAVPSALSAVVDGLPFEDLLTGFGVASAADAALRGDGGLEGRAVAVEGFGKVGGGVAREVVRRGGRIVAVSTLDGCVADPDGIDVDRLLALRADHGDRCVVEYRPAAAPAPAAALFTVAADVVVPGARIGVISEERARGLDQSVRAVVPAANVPYTAGGLDVLRERGIAALPDFVCNAGGVLGYRARLDAAPQEILADVERRVAALLDEVADHPDGPYAGACEVARTFLASWWGDAPPPPLAP